MVGFRGLMALNPLDIATNAEGGTTTIHVEGEQSFADMLQLGNLYTLLKRDALLWTTIIIAILLISMQFISKSEKLADRKEDILHKMKIAFLISSGLWFLELVISVFDKIF